MKIKPVITVLLILGVAIFFSSCFMKKDIYNEVDKVTFHYEDSSVPPKYHRSYTLTVTANSIVVVVDSYGDVLVDTFFLISKDNFKEIINFAEECELSNKNKTSIEDGCSGGTSKSVGLYKGDAEIVYGTVFKCGGQSYGNLKGDADEFGKHITSLIPDFKKLLE